MTAIAHIEQFLEKLRAELLKVSDQFTVAHLDAAAARVKDEMFFTDTVGIADGAVDPTKTEPAVQAESNDDEPTAETTEDDSEI